jgi:fatty-acyl-CoA synthase
MQTMSAGVINPSTDSPRLSGRPSPAKSWLKAIELTSRIEADPRRLFADLVEDWAKRQPDRPALISEAETFSYRALAESYRQILVTAGPVRRRRLWADGQRV